MSNEMNNLLKNKKLLTLNDYDMVKDYYQKYPEELCDFNISNTLSWGLSYKLEYTYFNKTLIFYNPFSDYLLFPSFSGLTAKNFYDINKEFQKHYPKAQITAITENNLKKIPNIDDYFIIRNDEIWNDYVYLSSDLVNLSGKKLSKKKNLISQFDRLYPDYKIIDITTQDKQELLSFCSRWYAGQNSNDEHINTEAEAIDIVLTNWDLFPCNGIKLYANDKLCAFSVWSPQTPEMVTEHFEKSDPNFKGSAQKINHEVAKRVYQKYKYINREQDVGDAGLRQAKRSYQPIYMVPFYNLIMRETNNIKNEIKFLKGE